MFRYEARGCRSGKSPGWSCRAKVPHLICPRAVGHAFLALVDRPVDARQARALLAEKDRKRRPVLDERYARASADFDRVSRLIADRYPVGRTRQWGSPPDRSRLSERSDIDIALEGVPGPRAFPGSTAGRWTGWPPS